MKVLFGEAMMAPPTGTIKFLSVLCTMASTRPSLHALVISEVILNDYDCDGGEKELAFRTGGARWERGRQCGKNM